MRVGKPNFFRDFVNKHHLPLNIVLNVVTLDGRCLQEIFSSGRAAWEVMPGGHSLYSKLLQLSQNHHLSQPHFSMILAE